MRSRNRWVPYLLVAPATILVVVLVAALAFLFIESLRPAVGERAGSLDQYKSIIASGDELAILWRSCWLAAVATVISLIAGYPVAYYLDRASRTARTALLAFLVLTFFSDYVLRMFGLVLLFGRNGVFNQMLGAIGVEPIKMMFNTTGVLLGLVASSLPFTILTTTGVLGRIDASQVSAARLLGASPWRAFLSVTLPLSTPGMVSGGVIVFLLSLNSFVVPSLLGGGFIEMIATHIYERGVNLFNLPFGAAASFILLVIAMVLLTISNAIFERHGRRFGVIPANRARTIRSTSKSADTVTT